MSQHVITPPNHGFALQESHPAGCAESVLHMWESVGPQERTGRRPTVLVVGSSAGYGLAGTVTALARHGMQGIGVSLECAPDRGSGSPGWYRTAATAALAEQAGIPFSFVNADALAETTKQHVADLLADRFGPLDYLLYTAPDPQRIDSDTGKAAKPIGAASTTKTVRLHQGTPTLTTVTTEPATENEIADTVAALGGQDWRRWIRFLDDADLLAPGISTAALSYLGSSLTAPIFRTGSIGLAKADLEQTGRELHADLAERHNGRAVTSVIGGAVTPTTAAVPGNPLYLALLRDVLGPAMMSPTVQLVDLWDQLTGANELRLDEHGRLRLDSWELNKIAQQTVEQRWAKTTDGNLSDLADLDWFQTEVRRLHGFNVVGVDYTMPTETDVSWPTR